MMLNRVVLPDPLGPMRAVMVPSFTIREAPSTARTPPNTLVTSCTESRSVMTHRHRAWTRRLAHWRVFGLLAGRLLRPPGDGGGAAAGGPRWSAGSRAAGAEGSPGTEVRRRSDPA